MTSTIRERCSSISKKDLVDYLLILFSLISAGAFSGIVFGWAPLQLILQKENQYCFNGNIDSDCSEQKLHFSYIFTVSAFVVAFCALPSGLLLDHVGAPTTITLAFIFEVTGLILMAISDSHSFDAFIYAYALIGIQI